MTDATPTQPTGSGKWIWRKPLLRDVVDCAQFAKVEAVPPTLGETTFAKLAMMFPDPRDARIAELEAALRETRKLLLDYRFGQGKRIGQAVEFIEAELWTPESDMTITQEAMDA